MTTLTEGRHAAESVLSEEDCGYCREVITILSGEGELSANQVVGIVQANEGAVSVAAATFTGTGNGTLTNANPAYGVGVQEGNYTVRLIEAGTNAGSFEVIRPDGTIDGIAAVGVAYDGQVKFTIADGATDFAAAAQFVLAVTIADPTGVDKYRSADPTNTDGSGVAKAVLLYAVDATDADAKVVALVRGPAQVNGNRLVYDAAVDDDTKRATKNAELAAVGIIVR